MSEKHEIQCVEIQGELMDLVSFGIEELESRQEMALIALNPDVTNNSKCPTNDGCTINKVDGCGGTSQPEN